MKKFPGSCILLVLLLTLQLVCTPVLATEAETEAQVQTEENGSEATQGPSEETTEPIVYTIPEYVTGDASITAGCHSIDAAEALILPEELEVDAKAALMYELNSDTLLYDLNADERLYPASVTKVMTCLLALENGDLADTVTVSRKVIDNVDPNGSNVALAYREEMTLRDMLYCLMVASANDAASAIAEHIGGSEADFVQMMNDKAAELGCTNTNFANPHGLHDENHYTSARDLARILMAALEYEEFSEIYSAKTYDVPETNRSEARHLVSTNYLIEDSKVDQYYDERVIGGKTGYTTPAGRCLVAVSESGDMKLLTVVLGGGSGYNEQGSALYGNFKATINLIDHGFNNYGFSLLLSPDAVMASLPVTGGENDTQAVVKEAFSAVVPANITNDQLTYDFVYHQENLTAPVEAGQELGCVRVWYKSMCLAQKEVYATVASPVKPTQAPADPAVGNAAAGEGSNFVQIILIAILVVLVLIVILIVGSHIHASIRRARRRRNRKNQRRSR